MSDSYAITAICRKSEREHIIRVKMFKVGVETSVNAIEWTKDQVVTLINGGRSIYTYPNNSIGAIVRVYHYKGNNYLRSDKDDTPTDNLGNLTNYCD